MIKAEAPAYPATLGVVLTVPLKEPPHSLPNTRLCFHRRARRENDPKKHRLVQLITSLLILRTRVQTSGKGLDDEALAIGDKLPVKWLRDAHQEAA